MSVQHSAALHVATPFEIHGTVKAGLTRQSKRELLHSGKNRLWGRDSLPPLERKMCKSGWRLEEVTVIFGARWSSEQFGISVNISYHLNFIYSISEQAQKFGKYIPSHSRRKVVEVRYKTRDWGRQTMVAERGKPNESSRSVWLAKYRFLLREMFFIPLNSKRILRESGGQKIDR